MHALILPRSATSLYAVFSFSIAALVPLLVNASWWVELGVALSLAVAGAAAAVDFRTGRIPDRLVLLAAVPATIVVVGQAAFETSVGHIGAAAVGAAALAGPLLVVHLTSPGSMGFGDVKLAAVLGTALGVIDSRAALVALCLAAAVTAAIGLAQRRSELPLGPGLVAGAVVAIPLTAVVIEGTVPWR